MIRRCCQALLLLVVLSLPSCASLRTTFNIGSSGDIDENVPRVYSGTIYTGGLILGTYYGELRDYVPFFFYPVLIVDLPLSLAMDTILLPYTIYTQVRYGNFGSK